MERKKIIEEVGEILDTYCNDCFLKTHNRKEYGKSYAQVFCIKKCTVGETLREYGRKLSLNTRKEAE
ncbi:zinc-finger domain-containing protein [Bacillus sp. PS06]|uniref:zinc-finger domain-containing protein n=1 Tax=Bacillus sp. PS06 TaxID=2764176 RepID=UPI001783E1F7|nr:zinc-finger domain-containing protein [Bacillus sp. PS06]MBD8068145.1 zinc-finger domain-containing protein [Bacillus sp. PS06]